LIVADYRRDGPTSFKAVKDRQQAAFSLKTMAEDRPADIWDAYKDGMARVGRTDARANEGHT